MKLPKWIQRVFSREQENNSHELISFERKIEIALLEQMHLFICEHPHSYFLQQAPKDLKFRRR